MNAIGLDGQLSASGGVESGDRFGAGNLLTAGAGK
jgi:hypothetical protein